MVSNWVRRLFDILMAGSGLIVVSPLFVFVAIAIKINSPGPVFYRAKRVGKDGDLFRLFKFRSMKAGADKKGPGITVSGDNRITSVGRILRRTKIDELPQLLNVLWGEMSLVGPRPEDPRYVARYTAEQRQVLRVRPGITSAASLAYRHEERMLSGEDWERRYCEEVMPAKLAIDLDYLSKRSLWIDLTIIVRTVLSMVE